MDIRERMRVVRQARPARVLLMLIVLVGVACAFSGGVAVGESPDADKVTLRVGWTNRPDSLNPFIGYELSSYEIYHLNYDLLFGFGADDLQPVPELAAELPTEENGGFSADGKTVTVKLREGVTWHDGEPFTAADVAFTWNYSVENDLSAFASYVDGVVRVEVVDDSTVRFILDRPKANFLRQWVPVLPEHIWSRISPKDAERAYENPPPIVGTGPFQVVEWNRSQDYVRMVANKDYWRGAPKIDEIIFTTYTNADTMAKDLKAGNVDVIYGVPRAQFESLGQVPGIETIAYPYCGFDDLGFNCYAQPTSLGNPVLKDWRFRQALNWAVDTEKIAETAFGGLAIPGTSLFPPDYFPTDLDWHWEPPPEEKYGFDLDRARAALDAAGYADSDGDGVREHDGAPIKLRLWALADSPMSQNAGKLLAGSFRDIGLDIEFQVMDTAALSDKIYNYDADDNYAPDFDMFLWRNGGDVEPSYILGCFTTDQIEDWSDCAWSNPTYDAMFEEQSSQIDQQERLQTVYEMQELLYKESPYIILVYPMELEAYNSEKWDGFVRSPKDVGGIIYTYNNIDSYLFVHAKSAASEGEGGANVGLIVGIVVAVVVVVGVGAWLVARSRRGGPAVED